MDANFNNRTEKPSSRWLSLMDMIEACASANRELSNVGAETQACACAHIRYSWLRVLNVLPSALCEGDADERCPCRSTRAEPGRRAQGATAAAPQRPARLA